MDRRQRSQCGRDARSILEKAGYSGEIDLLSVDIDGNDYWVGEVMSGETACSSDRIQFCLPPAGRGRCRVQQRFLMGRDELLRSESEGPRRTRLAKGLRACRLIPESELCAPFTAENYFEPPRFGFYKIGALDMHPAGVGKYKIV
jgi:hypothetical protein